MYPYGVWPGAAVDSDEVLMVWSTASGYGGAFYPIDMLMAGGVPQTTLGLDPQLSELAAKLMSQGFNELRPEERDALFRAIVGEKRGA